MGSGDVGGSIVSRFWSGAAFAASGIPFTLRHPRLLLWSLVPMLVQAAIFIALLVWGSQAIGGLVERFGPDPGHWYSFMGALLGAALVVLLIFGCILGSIFLGGVLCDPFFDVLSEATESEVLKRDVGQPFHLGAVARGIVMELFATLWRLLVFSAVALPLWLLGLTGAGSIIAVPLSLAWSFLFVALAGLSRSMARHAIPGRRRLRALFADATTSLGFGAVGWVLSYVPLTAPFLVVGGTRLYLTLAAWDRIESNLTEADKRTIREASTRVNQTASRVPPDRQEIT